jgi:hypothetical protein
MITWLEEGLTYREIAERHLAEFGVQIAVSTVASFAERNGLDGRFVRVSANLPWQIRPEHYHQPIGRYLRWLARRRAGETISPESAGKLDRWLSKVEAENVVVDYDPESEFGWELVERRPGIDLDVYRKPD